MEPEARQRKREREEGERLSAETAAKAHRDAIARRMAGIAPMKAANQAGKTDILLTTLHAGELPNVRQSFGVSHPLIWQTALFLDGAPAAST